MQDFEQACKAIWGGAAPCPEYHTAADAVKQINLLLGCSSINDFSDALWEHPELRGNSQWCEYVRDEYVPALKQWALDVQPWGWRGEKRKPIKSDSTCAPPRLKLPKGYKSLYGG